MASSYGMPQKRLNLAPECAPAEPDLRPATPEIPSRQQVNEAASKIGEALRRADVANPRELAEAIAELVVDALRDGRFDASAGEPRASADVAFERLAVLSGGARRRPHPSDIGAPVAQDRRPKLCRILALGRNNCGVLASWRKEGVTAEPTSNLVAALKPFVIREFASAHGESRILNFLGGRVLLRASERVILAGQFSGEPDPDDKARLDAEFKALLKGDKPPSDADLASVAMRVKAPPAPRWSSRQRVAVGAAALACCGVALAALLREGPESRLQKLAAEAQARQPALSGWPLSVSVDRDAGVATVRGVAPPAADLDALAQALPTSPYRWELQVPRVATAESFEAADARLNSLSGRMEDAEKRLGALDGRLDRAEKWRSERVAEAEAPAARLARLAQATVILFRDDDDFLDQDLARRQIAEIAARLKEADLRLRIVGLSDAKGSASKNVALSKARAGKVLQALVAEGVPAKRLVAVGRADLAPIASETGADRRRNRRVTFEVLAAGNGVE